MPVDFTNLPDKVPPKQSTQGGVDMSGLPDKGPSDTSHNHPILAALTRLLGGVGSAIASPADVTGFGTVIPAAISGASESAAEWLEGSEQSPARIATEAAIGAVPFAKLVKSGRMVANMGKAAVLGGVGEGAREKAKGEDLSPLQIGGSAALNAATYGLFHKFLGGGRVAAKKPDAPFEVVPTSQTGKGTSVIAKVGKGKGTKIVRSGPIAAPTPIKPTGESISVAGGTVEPDTRAAVPGTSDVTAYGGPAGKSSQRANRIATLEEIRDQKNLERVQKWRDTQDTAARLKTERANAGLEPSTTFSESESGVDASGKRVSKNTKFAPPDEQGGGDVDLNENPLVALERQLGMRTKPKDELFINPQQDAPFGGASFDDLTPSNVDETGWVPKPAPPKSPAPFDIFHAGKAPGHEWNEFTPGPPMEGAPWGGAAIPDLNQYLVDTAERAIHEGNAASVGGVPVLGTSSVPVQVPNGKSPVDALKKVLSPRSSRSVKTVEGFQRAMDKRIKAGGLPGDVPVVPQDAPGTIIGDTAIPTPSQPVNVVPSATDGLPEAFKPLAGPPSPPTPPESPLLKILKTRQGATGANYRAAKDAAKRGEIPSADYARDSHLVELGKEPEGPFAGPPAPRTPGQTIDQLLDAQGTPRTAPVEGGMVEPPPTGNPDAGAAASPDAPDWIRKANEDLEAMKKDRGQQGSINPGLLRFLTAGTGAAIGGPVGSYLDPDDPNASVKGALAGGALGWAGSGGVQNLINWRNAGLLATPSAQMKKPLSDMGAYVGHALEQAISGNRELAVNMGRESLRVPTNVSNYIKAFRDPRLAEDVIGDTAKPYIEPAKGLMGLVARPFAGAQYATSQAMQRAGVTPEEAKNVLLLGTPKAELWKRWLDLQKLPGWQGQAVRAARPFARIGTNLFERGWERIPGISMMTGDPETRTARTILGIGALAAGAMTGHSDAQDLEQGGYEASPIVRGLRRALLASYGVPFMVGEAMTGPAGIRDLVYMTPGATQTVPVPAPKDTFGDYGKKIGKRWLDQMMPDWLVPQDWEAKPQR